MECTTSCNCRLCRHILINEEAHIKALARIQHYDEMKQSMVQDLTYLRMIEDGTEWEADYRDFKERLRKKEERI